jgi:hypothetical protein
MITATAAYLEQEALAIGATPAVRATILPYTWPPGVDGDGSFTHCAYVPPDRIQADYEGFTGGEWVSEIQEANLQVFDSPAVVTYTLNTPGFTSVLYWRGADNTTDLAAASWTALASGNSIDITPYYQFKLTMEGYRAWAIDDPGDADDFTAYAVDSSPDADDSYASDAAVPGDPLTYLEDLIPLGEFTLVADIETAGSVSLEMPTDFSDLVAGSHSGLTLNNRQKDLAGDPAPRYSPDKSSFLFANEDDWYGKLLRIGLGYQVGGWYASEFLADGFFEDVVTDDITLFLGKITKWGPVSRALGSPNTVEIYAKDFISDCLQKRICLPAADGTPAPLTFGEFLAKAEAVSGWTPAPIVRACYFDLPDYHEFDSVIASGGGAISLVTPGQVSTRAFQAAVTGASQAAYGLISMTPGSEIFISGTMTFVSIPAAPVSGNLTFLFIDGTGTEAFYIDDTGAICATHGGQSKFNIMAYEGVPLAFTVWSSPTNPGWVKLWINGDEVLTSKGNFSGANPDGIQIGAQTGGHAETWTIQFENLEVRTKYYVDAYRVTGYPFTDIGSVYIDNRAQPDSQTTGGYTQTVTRYPEYGLVQFASDDPDFNLSGEVMFRVIETAGGRHALYVIEQLLAAAGVTEYVDAPALAAAYAAVPNDYINARFEGGSSEKYGLKDYASLGLPIADALKEITSRMLYWIFIDAGAIKIMPYTGTAPASPVLALTGANMREAQQTIDMDQINAFVSATYGWYDRNPVLYYVAGDQTAGGQGTGLDFTWDSPVACENRAVVKAKVDLLLKFLSAQERIDPATLNLAGARVELMDPVSLSDPLLNDAAKNYWVAGKEVSLDQGSQGTSLQLIRFLGE